MKYLVFIFFFCWVGLTACGSDRNVSEKQSERQPVLFPDYTDVTFPVNIAPPNCRIMEEGDVFRVEVGTDNRMYYQRKSKSPDIRIPFETWRLLAEENSGKSFFVRVAVQKAGEWVQYKAVQNQISTDSIDAYLVYRRLYPGYELWNEMGIYQRDLTTYGEEPILENRSSRSTCMNCHTFCRNRPETAMIHTRGEKGGTLVLRNGTVKKVEMKTKEMQNGGTYAAWHPEGRYIALSVNEILQFFHATGEKPIEVSDMESDLMLWDCETDRIVTDSLLYGPEWMETFPAWSPDGNTLYFCRSKAVTKQTPLDSIYYDLYRIPFDATRCLFGQPECVYAASASHKSVSFPRVSPDGRYVMFTLSDYGNFSIWHPESDLYLLDLQSGKVRCLKEVNSERVESFHNWSSTGKWFVFSSKRIDGLWAHPYIAPFDPTTGSAGKPFPIPQEEPDFYLTFMQSFNLPEFLVRPLTENRESFEQIQNKCLSSPPNQL